MTEKQGGGKGRRFKNEKKKMLVIGRGRRVGRVKQCNARQDKARQADQQADEAGQGRPALAAAAAAAAVASASARESEPKEDQEEWAGELHGQGRMRMAKLSNHVTGVRRGPIRPADEPRQL